MANRDGVRPPVARGKGWAAHYVPANHRRDLPKGSRHRAMDSFLLSPQLQDVVLRAGEDIAGEARGMAIEEGVAETGEYASSFDARVGPPLSVGPPFPNPRVSVIVSNDAGDADTGYSVAADVEYGTSTRPGKRILYRAGLKYHTPRGIA